MYDKTVFEMSNFPLGKGCCDMQICYGKWMRVWSAGRRSYFIYIFCYSSNV